MIRVAAPVVMAVVALVAAPTPGFGAPRAPQDPPPVLYDTLSTPDGRVRVLYQPVARSRADFLVEFFGASAPLPGLPDTVPVSFEVVLAPSEEAFTRAIGAAVPEWGAAVAIPSESRIVLPGYGSSRGRWNDRQTLRHEFAHIGLHGYLDGLRVPRWFSEGYAEWASGGWDFAQAWKLRLLLARGNSSLDSLNLRWPRSRSEAEAAYLLSASAVEYLIASSNAEGMALFLERWRESGNFEGAFRRTFGGTSGQFERDWKEFVKRRYGWLFVISHSSVFWLLLTLASFWMWRVRRHRNRLRMARLRAREIPELPAYWLAVGTDGRRGPLAGYEGTSLAPKPDGPAVGGSEGTGPEDSSHRSTE